LLLRAGHLATEWREAIHSLRDLPRVIDIRTIGLIAGIELQPRADAIGTRAYEVFVKAFDKGLLTRVTGDIIALSPPLIIETGQIDQIVSTLHDVLLEIL
jgi:beta-alanine--pyruvate transaminase